MLKVGVIGADGRTTGIIRALERSHRVQSVVRLSSGKTGSTVGSVVKARAETLQKARVERPDFVVIGPEEPLAAGFVEALRDELGIQTVGPTTRLAQLETSKAFTRNLIANYGIGGNPQFRVFTEIVGMARYLQELGGFVIKPDGLTGGKGVRVSDAHVHSIDEALSYCSEVFRAGQTRIVIEEKLEGEEFSLQSFCDGFCVKHMPIAQDHKRIGENDTGPNTGGMGSYSCSDHTLPFLTREDVQAAKRINVAVSQALCQELGEPYKGILYGGFMATRDGVRLVEYNARFADPEALNVLPLLETDFSEICEAIINGTLDRVSISFARMATVCKYVVPKDYPEGGVTNAKIDLSNVPSESQNLQIFEAAIDKRSDGTYLTGSRAVAFVGIAKSLEDAEEIAETAVSKVVGPVYHRRDIGTRELVNARIDHLQQIRSASPSGCGSASPSGCNVAFADAAVA